MAATGAFFSSVPKIHKQGCAAPFFCHLCTAARGAFIRLPRTRTPLPFLWGPSLHSPCPATEAFPFCFASGPPSSVSPENSNSWCTFFFAEGQLFIVHHKARHAHHLIFLTQSRKMSLNHTHPPSPAGSPPQCAGRPRQLRAHSAGKAKPAPSCAQPQALNGCSRACIQRLPLPEAL